MEQFRWIAFQTSHPLSIRSATQGGKNITKTVTKQTVMVLLEEARTQFAT